MEPGAKIPWRRLVARAAAELAVIVLGVSIALWADSRAALHDRRAVETARLHALSANIEDTLADLRACADETEQVVAALREVLSFRDKASPADTIYRYVREGYLEVPDFQPQLGVYDDLKNSGELALLTNAQLRQTLSAMEAKLRQVAVAQADVGVVQQLNMDRYLVQRMDLESLLREIDGTNNRPRDASTAFVSDREFRNLILLKLDVMGVMAAAIADAEPELLAVQATIAQQLGREDE